MRAGFWERKLMLMHTELYAGLFHSISGTLVKMHYNSPNKIPLTFKMWSFKNIRKENASDCSLWSFFKRSPKNVMVKMFRFKSQPNQSFFTKLSFSKSMLGHCLPFLDCFESNKKFFCSKIRNLDQCGFILQNTIVNFSLVFPKALKIRCFDGHHTLFCLLSFKATET